MGLADYIGGRGEAIAFAHLTGPLTDANDGPLFWPHHLGEKCRTFDFFVESIGPDPVIPFFFVQVKTTRKPLTKSHDPPRLPIRVEHDDVARMVAYPAPAYIIGVHERSERAFIVAPPSTPTARIGSITTAHELNASTLQRLRDEVGDFWVAAGRRPTSSFRN